MTVVYTWESPTTPDVVALIAQLDAYMGTLYPPDDNFLVPAEGLAEAEAHFCVARLQGDAAGCGALVSKGDYWEIKRMWVNPSQRGMGIAQGLIERLLGVARDSKVPVVRLETGNLNPDAMRLYERSGFYRIENFGEYAGSESSVCYELILQEEPA